MARPTLLTEELVQKAQGYLDTCIDTYKKFEEVLEDENQDTLPESEEMYKQARDFVRQQGGATTSAIQRELKIGYARAARLMDMLEAHMVVGESDGVRPREILDYGLELDYGMAIDEDQSQPRRRQYTSYRNTHTRLEVKPPSIAGLARYLGISRETVRLWAAEGESKDADPLNKEFFGIVEDVLAEQEERLISKGLSGQYSPVLAKLLLHKHGYSDKTDLTSGGQPFFPSPEQKKAADAAIDRILPVATKDLVAPPPQAEPLERVIEHGRNTPDTTAQG